MQQPQELRRALVEPLVSLAILVGIHLIGGKNDLDAGVRLALTVVYFAAALHLMGWLVLASPAVFHRLYAWRYEHAHGALGTQWKAFLEELDIALKAFFIPLAVGVASLAVKVLAAWDSLSFLRGLAFLYDGLWLVALVIWLILMVVYRHRFAAVVQSFLDLYGARKKSGFEPRPMRELWHGGNETPGLAPVDDKPLHFRAAGTGWSWNELGKGCILFGQPGSGKTSCVMNALLDGLLMSSADRPDRPGGLLVDPKGDFRSKIIALCRRYGREQDLIVFSPHDAGNPVRWNPLDTTESVQDVSQKFLAIMDVLEMNATNTHWRDMAKTFFGHALHLVRITNSPRKPANFADILRMARRPEEIARRADLLAHDDPRGDETLEFFAEWLDPSKRKDRAAVVTNLTNLLDDFVAEPFKTTLSGRSSFTMADLVSQGKILYFDSPMRQGRVMGRLVGVLLKLAYYHEVLKYADGSGQGTKRWTLFFCDEFQRVFTATEGQGDADFFAVSRSARHVNVVATQNLPGLYNQSGRPGSVDALLGNCLTKVFLRNNDEATNEFAAKQFGKAYVELGSTGKRIGSSGSTIMHSKRAEQAYRVEPEKFATLVVPDPDAGVDYCESMLLKGAGDEPTGAQRSRWPLHLL